MEGNTNLQGGHATRSTKKSANAYTLEDDMILLIGKKFLRKDRDHELTWEELAVALRSVLNRPTHGGEKLRSRVHKLRRTEWYQRDSVDEVNTWAKDDPKVQKILLWIDSGECIWESDGDVFVLTKAFAIQIGSILRGIEKISEQSATAVQCGGKNADVNGVGVNGGADSSESRANRINTCDGGEHQAKHTGAADDGNSVEGAVELAGGFPYRIKRRQ